MSNRYCVWAVGHDTLFVCLFILIKAVRKCSHWSSEIQCQQEQIYHSNRSTATTKTTIWNLWMLQTTTPFCCDLFIFCVIIYMVRFLNHYHILFWAVLRKNQIFKNFRVTWMTASESWGKQVCSWIEWKNLFDRVERINSTQEQMTYCLWNFHENPIEMAAFWEKEKEINKRRQGDLWLAKASSIIKWVKRTPSHRYTDCNPYFPLIIIEKNLFLMQFYSVSNIPVSEGK